MMNVVRSYCILYCSIIVVYLLSSYWVQIYCDIVVSSCGYMKIGEAWEIRFPNLFLYNLLVLWTEVLSWGDAVPF